MNAFVLHASVLVIMIIILIIITKKKKKKNVYYLRTLFHAVNQQLTHRSDFVSKIKICKSLK